MHETLTAYYQSICLFGSVVRKRLCKYNGYECKEPEAGKFTLVFHTLKEAILWACHVHAELLTLDWPDKLLSLDECRAEEKDGRIIHRGLRVKIGMVYGRGLDKKPLSTGRADYFGTLPNIAARISSLARPGQVLIHTSSGFSKCGIQWINDKKGILKYSPALQSDGDGVSELAVEICELGLFLLRGVNELKKLYQVISSDLFGLDYKY